MLVPNWKHQFYFDGDSGGNGGGDGGAGDGDGGTPLSGSTPEKSFQRLVDRQGGYDAAGLLLFQENREYRDKLRQANDEIADLKKKLPKEGAVILSDEEITKWQAYQALGTPEEIKSGQQSLTEMQRAQLINQAAELHSFKPAVLQRLIDGLEIEFKEIDQDGKKVKQAFVKNGEQETVLPEYAKANWGDFLPALQQEQRSTPGVPPSPPPAGEGDQQPRQEERKKRSQSMRRNIRQWM